MLWSIKWNYFVEVEQLVDRDLLANFFENYFDWNLIEKSVVVVVFYNRIEQNYFHKDFHRKHFVHLFLIVVSMNPMLDERNRYNLKKHSVVEIEIEILYLLVVLKVNRFQIERVLLDFDLELNWFVNFLIYIRLNFYYYYYYYSISLLMDCMMHLNEGIERILLYNYHLLNSIFHFKEEKKKVNKLLKDKDRWDIHLLMFHHLLIKHWEQDQPI